MASYIIGRNCFITWTTEDVVKGGESLKKLFQNNLGQKMGKF